jgi:hypothetical protein
MYLIANPVDPHTGLSREAWPRRLQARAEDAVRCAGLQTGVVHLRRIM